MNLAADLGGIFIVLDVTALAFFCTNYKYETDRTLGESDRLDSNQFR